MKKTSAAFSSIVILLIMRTIMVTPTFTVMTLASPNHPKGFIYVEDDRLMLNGAQFVMKGFNYYPRDYGWTSMMDWNWTEVDQELALGASLHANTIRTGINFQYSTGNINAEKNIYKTYQIPQDYFNALDTLLSLADKHGLKVVLWLFDGLYWELWDPAHFDVVEKYLEELIPQYANDTRIAAWDLMTDMDGSIGYSPLLTKDNMVSYLRNTAETIRKLDKNHLLTVGFCWPSSSLLVQDFTDFLFPQFLGGDHPNIVNDSTPGQFEDYGQWGEVLTDKEAVLTRLEAKVRSLQNQLIKPMPIVFSEFGLFSAQPESSLEMQRRVYEVVCELVFLRLKLAGALYWVLTDFIWPPKAYTIVPETAPQSTPSEQTFGVFTLNYTAKPAAEVVSRYYRDCPDLTLQPEPAELQFVFSKSKKPSDVYPFSEDERALSVAFDTINFLALDGRILDILDLGLPEARQYLESGFFEDEDEWGGEAVSFVWAGGPSKTATIRIPFPNGTQSIMIRASSMVLDMFMDVLVEGERVTRLSILPSWHSYNVPLHSMVQPFVGDTITVQGRFCIPISEGIVTLQVSYEGITWINITTTMPENGRFSAPITFTQAGTCYVRAVWSDGGYYLPSTSGIVLIEILSPSKIETTISCNLSHSLIPIGEEVVVTGKISPLVVGGNVVVTVSGTDGSIATYTSNTGPDGSYREIITTNQADTYEVRSSWEGDEEYSGATSQEKSFTTFEPELLANLKIYVVDVNGDPVRGASIISISTPNGQSSLIEDTVSDGSVSFSGVKVGSYTFEASKSGYITEKGTLNAIPEETVGLTILLEKEAKGIPSFPYKSIILGIIVGVFLIWWMKRRT